MMKIFSFLAALVLAAPAFAGQPPWQGFLGAPNGIAPLDSNQRLPIASGYDINTQIHAIGMNYWINARRAIMAVTRQGGGAKPPVSSMKRRI